MSDCNRSEGVTCGMTRPFTKREHTSCDLRSLFIWNVRTELLLQSHHKLHAIEAVRAEILAELCSVEDLTDREVSGSVPTVAQQVD